MSAATVTCASCRHEHAATALFCPHCGRPRIRDDGDALLGKILGDRFLVQERLGQGASGTIYRAEHVTLRRKVAIKVLHHEMSRDDLAIERFRREATTVADIDNEHIVEIHDFGRTSDGRLYLAMELLDGETLDGVLAREGRMPFDRVVDVMVQVGEALIEAHAIGYIHRDIRPRNIFLQQRRGRANFVKLLDFGLAKLVEAEGQAASTSLGMTFGDPRYMSPEQARGDAIDRRADIYQLGCVAYEMLTGAPPFVGARMFDVLARHINEAPAPLRRARPDVPAWLDAAVQRMLAKVPDERFATMSRMVEALRLGEQSGTILPASTAQRVETEPPASVSRAMEKLAKTALGPHGDDAAAAAAAVADDAPTQTLPKVGRTGTPKVGVPVVTAPAPAQPPPADKPVWTRPPRPDPSADTRADGIAGGVNPASFEPTEANPLPVAPERPAPAAPAAKAPSSTGKLPGRNKRATDNAGISSVWYADGEKLDGGADLEESQAERLDRARRLISAGDSLSDGYAPPRRPIGKIVAFGAGGVLLVVLIAVVLAGGGSSDGEAAKTVAADRAAVPDAAPRPAVVVDAGVAAPVDAAPAPVPAPTPKSPKSRPDKIRVDKPDRVDRPDKDPVDPLDAVKPAVDDEAKLQAEFFAKTGESQLRSGDGQAAASSFKKALELDPRNVDAVVGLGEVAMQQGLYGAAIKHLKKAAKLARGRAIIHTLLGECYLNSGNNKAAEAAFKQALKIDPDNQRARDGYNEASARIPPPADEP